MLWALTFGCVDQLAERVLSRARTGVHRPCLAGSVAQSRATGWKPVGVEAPRGGPGCRAGSRRTNRESFSARTCARRPRLHAAQCTPVLPSLRVGTALPERNHLKQNKSGSHQMQVGAYLAAQLFPLFPDGFSSSFPISTFTRHCWKLSFTPPVYLSCDAQSELGTIAIPQAVCPGKLCWAGKDTDTYLDSDFFISKTPMVARFAYSLSWILHERKKAKGAGRSF